MYVFYFLPLNTVPGCPSGIKILPDIVLVWQKPEIPNGVIVGYDARVSVLHEDGTRDRTLYMESFLPDEFSHVLRRSQLHANSTIRCEV